MSNSTNKKKIHEVILLYLKALYSQDFETAYSLLYKNDTEDFRNAVINFAIKIDEFGETDGFLKTLGLSNLKELQKLSTKEFMRYIFKNISSNNTHNDLLEIVDKTEITNIEEIKYLAHVKYRLPYKIFDAWEYLESEVDLIFSNNKWQILFKSGLREGLKQFETEINNYNRRKQNDRPENIGHDGDLSTFSLVGFKNLEGQTVIEPRFKDAGNFENGLAYVQIISKYGYINTNGNLVIKPQFDKACNFSEGLASVKKNYKWGFIDTNGDFIVVPLYDDTSYFTEGMCAVKLKNKWGFVNSSGKQTIPFKFDEVADFMDGTAWVEIHKKDRIINIEIDKQGNIVD